MKLLQLVMLSIAAVSLLASSVFETAQAAERRVPTSQLEVQLSYSGVVKKAAPAVVNIYTKRVVKSRSTSPFANDPFFQRFFGNSFGGAPRQRIERSLGSGVIVRDNGIIITNHHVIEGADEITVALSDRREFSAKVVLDDERTDLAVLRIKTGDENLPFLKFANSDDVEVGDMVLAIGNPFGVGQTVTGGIVSALARTQVGGTDYQFFIQTDAAVNPGNSGGALVAMDGRLLGINTSIFSRSGGSNGIGFAIPANMVDSVVSAALADGKVTRPWFGASGQVVSAEIAESLGLDRPGGVLVDNIYPNGPADKAGLEPGDVILSIDGKEIMNPQALRYHIGLKKAEGRVPLKVVRGEKIKMLSVPLEAAPEDPPRNVTILTGDHIFNGMKVANLSPAYADEIGVSLYDRGVIILEVNRSVSRRTTLRPGDIFNSFNEENIARVGDLEEAIEDSGNELIFSIKRQGNSVDCVISSRRRSYCR